MQEYVSKYVIDQIHVQLTRSNTVIKELFKYLYNLKSFK
jgi:hypothetical protein